MDRQPIPGTPPPRPRVAPPPGELPRPVIPVVTKFPYPIVKRGR